MMKLPELSPQARERVKQALKDAAGSIRQFDRSEGFPTSVTEALGDYILEVFDARAAEYWELVPHEQFETFCKDWLIPDVADKAVKKTRYHSWSSSWSSAEDEQRAEAVKYLMDYLPVTLDELAANDPDIALPQEHHPPLETKIRYDRYIDGVRYIDAADLLARDSNPGTLTHPLGLFSDAAPIAELFVRHASDPSLSNQASTSKDLVDSASDNSTKVEADSREVRDKTVKSRDTRVARRNPEVAKRQEIVRQHLDETAASLCMEFDSHRISLPRGWTKEFEQR